MNKKLMISTFLFILFLGGLTLGSATGQEKKVILHKGFVCRQADKSL